MFSKIILKVLRKNVKMTNLRILQIFKFQFFLTLLCSLKFAECLVGRDLVLTPRQGLQLKGKSIYYEEDSSEASVKNQTIRPWERTLKHVTFVTLFTKAATSAADGNINKLKEYKDFLDSVYVVNQQSKASRFGDIVTLAAGRVESIGNNSFQFIEGSCDYECEPERVWALWQVQKIRHREQNQRYRYEMKFSVSPLRTEASNENEVNENAIAAAEALTGNTLNGNYAKGNTLQTYIQRDEDYPKSFGRIIYPEEIAFADRRQDDFMGRNFRQANAYKTGPPQGQQNFNDYRQVTPIPQPTFLHGIFQPHPPPPIPEYPPSSEHLNIGEYVKHYGVLPKPATAPKIELFPNIFNMKHKTSNFITPTTFRPHYQMKFPRPDIYQQSTTPHFQPEKPVQPNPIQQNHEFIRFTANDKMKSPLVTHHFHHHFFMPNAIDEGAAANSINSAEIQQQQLKHIKPERSQYFTKDIVTQVTPSYFSSSFDHTTKAQQEFTPPAPQKISFPLNGEHIVEVTPPSVLKKPESYSVYPVTINPKVPLLIYQPPLEATQRIRQKPFQHSEPMPEPIRYSEPDPLYINADNDDKSQVESPPQITLNRYGYGEVKPDSISDQLPAPEKGQDLRIPYEDESPEASIKEKSDLLSTHSQKQPNQVATERPKTTTPESEESIETHVSTTTTTTTTTTPTPITTQRVTQQPPVTTTTTRSFNLFKTNRRISTTFSPTKTTTTPAPSLKTTPKYVSSTTASDFVSTSTTETPLRAISRQRFGGNQHRPTTTTTEPAVLKWKPKRRNHHSVLKFNSNSAVANTPIPKDNKARGSVLHEEKVFSPNRTLTGGDEETEEPKPIIYATLPPPSSTSKTTTAKSEKTSSNNVESSEESYEVLTQKSISRSVSIKVGENGSEIPILVDDEFVANEINAD